MQKHTFNQNFWMTGSSSRTVMLEQADVGQDILSTMGESVRSSRCLGVMI